MKIKKLNLDLDTNYICKKLLCDIVNEISFENDFMFFSKKKPKGHVDYKEHMDFSREIGRGYGENFGFEHTDYEEHQDEIRYAEISKHVDYIKKYQESYKF